MNKALSKWLSGESELFTILCGESFTRYDVAMASLYVAVVVICLGLAGTIG